LCMKSGGKVNLQRERRPRCMTKLADLLLKEKCSAMDNTP
jgi:hypothetical protein